MRRTFAAIIALIAWVGLAVHFANALTTPANEGIPIIERTIRFFSFFTVVSNLIVAIVMSLIAIARDGRLTRFVNRAGVLSASAVYITIVAVVYSLFLRGTNNPQGLLLISDHIVHDIVPPLFVLYWLFLAPKSGITWLDPIRWLIVPIIYMVYCLVHGALDNWYPYWFGDVTTLGYPTALRNSLFVLIAFAAFGYIYSVVARLLPGRSEEIRTTDSHG
jgi:hypothetical protein